MKKTQLRKIIRESIKELMTEQQGPFQLGNVTVNIGDRVFFSVPGGPNITTPNNLPTDPSFPTSANYQMFSAQWANSGPLAPRPYGGAGGTHMVDLCCSERGYEILSTNINDIQNFYYNGGSLKPNVYFSMTQGSTTGMGVAQSACQADYPYGPLNGATTQGTPSNAGQGCIAQSTPTPINPPIDTMNPNMTPAEFTSVSPNSNPEFYDPNNFKGDNLAKIKRR